jgi:hypothetical protein
MRRTDPYAAADFAAFAAVKRGTISVGGGNFFIAAMKASGLEISRRIMESTICRSWV